ncbi:MAG: hypothetical protein FWD64_06955 [Acidobacteriaceae bacterium]|nr:hypothetical protein [Acidobacteriaceae bacterium]
MVLHDPRLNESYPHYLYTHMRLILPPDAYPGSSIMKSTACIGECRIVFQNNIADNAAQFTTNDIIYVSGYLITGYIRESNITTNKIMANYAVSLNKARFSDCDAQNHIEISGILGDDPVVTYRPVRAWSVHLNPHLSPDLHPLRAPEKQQFRNYQVLFSESIRDKAAQFTKNELVLVCGYFFPSCACHPRTSGNYIVASQMTHLGNTQPITPPGMLSRKAS